jgi:predicted ATPase
MLSGHQATARGRGAGNDERSLGVLSGRKSAPHREKIYKTIPDEETGESVPQLDFHPHMVGREDELRELKAYLDSVAQGRGKTLLISGEAGIGKTTVAEELKAVARSDGFQVMSGDCMYESLRPYMPFVEALRSMDLGYLLAEEAPRVEAVYLVEDTGLSIKEVLREETELDSDIFASMLSAVGSFVKDSLSILTGEETRDTLNRLGYGDYTILIESGRSANLVVILTGRENESLISDMAEILSNVDESYGNRLRIWNGDGEKVEGIERILQTLITSGKYDGIYHGKEDTKARRDSLFENVSLGLVRQARIMPTLLCIEDLQWADPSSLALMHHLAGSTRDSPLLILGTYRPEDLVAEEENGHPLVETMRLMSREDLFEKMELQRLPTQYMMEFLTTLLGNTDFNDDFTEQIYQKTEGNPLFIVELVKSFVEERIIEPQDGTWGLVKDIRDVSIPSKIYDLILRRLDRVKKEPREVLDCASVIGVEFTSEVLASVLNNGRMDLLKTLRGLDQRHRLIHAGNGNYVFDHSMIKEVLYAEIPPELRTEYHSVIAKSIEGLNEDGLDEVAGDLAFHYHRSGSGDKALLYLIKAAEKDYSTDEAIKFYNESLELEEEDQRRVETLDGLGDMYSVIGDIEKSRESYEGALDLAEGRTNRARIRAKIRSLGIKESQEDEGTHASTGDQQHRKALALSGICDAHITRGEYDRALRYCEKGLAMSEAIEDRELAVHYSLKIAEVHIKKKDFQKALDFCRAGYDISREIGAKDAIARSKRIFGMIYREQKRWRESIENFEESLRICEETGTEKELADSYFEFGLMWMENGNSEKEKDYLNKALDILEDLRLEMESERVKEALFSMDGIQRAGV